jgi:hypothetical protein
VARDPIESEFEDIGVFGVVKHLQNEIAIRDFPTRSEPLIWGTRVQGSEGVRFNISGFPHTKESLH